MKTQTQIAKIKAVILYIMQRFPEGVDYIKLFKILYFAQQDHLVRYGKVIVDESFRAVKHGPVPTYTYKALQIAEGKPLEGDFREFLSGIEVRDKKVCTTLQPDMDYLSGADCRSPLPKPKPHAFTSGFSSGMNSSIRLWNTCRPSTRNVMRRMPNLFCVPFM